jgi:ubiquinone/menaquinone biosynthesis C-methylase UbiE
MDIGSLQRHWNRLGSSDPMWAILTDRGKRNGGWDRAEFFATGRDLIEEVLRDVAALNVSFQRGRALDFGCGIGRLTQALAQHFQTIVGIDIAPSLIRQANEYNRVPDRCRYVLNSRDDLSVFGDREFDFVFSTIVLQHMHPRYAERYIAEFLRVLRPGGVAIFQIPEKPAHTPVGMALRVLPAWVVRPLRKMDMYGISQRRARQILSSGEAHLLEAKPNFESGPHWIAYRYFAQKARE